MSLNATPSANLLPTASRLPSWRRQHRHRPRRNAVGHLWCRAARTQARMRARPSPTRAPLTTFTPPHRLGRGATPGWPRLRQGVRQRTVVSGPAWAGMIEGGPRMIDLEIPSQVPAHCSPRPAAWPRRSSGRSRAVRPGRAHLSRRARRHGGAHRRFGPFRVSSRSGGDRFRQGGDAKPLGDPGVRNGANPPSVLSDPRDRPRRRRPHLSIPRHGLASAAIAAVANDEQQRRYAGRWAAMAITELDTGSDSAPSARPPSGTVTITCSTAKRSSSPRASAPSWSSWATLDRSLGKQAIKSFVVERSNPGLRLVRLGAQTSAFGPRTRPHSCSRTAGCLPRTCSATRRSGSAAGGFAGAMQTFDNTRPLVAAMALGPTRACLDTTRELLAAEGARGRPGSAGALQSAPAAHLIQMEADYAAARLLTLRAAYLADNGTPNSMEASMAKAKAGRTCVEVALACVSSCVEPPATASENFSRNGPGTPRSSTSSRGPSRSSCSSSRGGCSVCRAVN